MSEYDAAFYQHRHNRTEAAARRILGIVRDIVPSVEAVVDVGCGVGTWLEVSKELGATRIQGVEGSWVSKEPLRIPRESLLEWDLNNPLAIDGRYDLAICLEVAEHLKPASAKGLVSSLARLSDFVLFSAAIPEQRGVGHLNEQWPPYWISLFRAHNLVGIDVVRKRIWNDESIPLWYRRNLLLFVKEDRVRELHIASAEDAIPGETYLLTFDRATRPTVRLALRQLAEALVRRLRRSP